MASNDKGTEKKQNTQGNLSQMDELLRQGVDTKDSEGRTALWLASGRGISDVVELLLSHGANTEVSGADEFTPLQVACARGHLKVVKCLIQAGAHFNAVSANNFGGSVPTLFCIVSI